MRVTKQLIEKFKQRRAFNDGIRYQLKKELTDYSYLIHEVPKVYCHICNLSKIHYPAHVIISELEEKWLQKDMTQDDIKMFIEEYRVGSTGINEMIDQIKDYLEFEEDK